MIATATLAAQYAGTLDLLDSTKVDARATQPLPVAPSPPPREIALAADITTAPSARLHLWDPRWDYTFLYAPSFAVTDVELLSEAQPVVLNTGAATISWHDRFVRLTLSESASYGLEDTAYLYTTTGQGLAGGSGQPTTPTGTPPTGTVGGSGSVGQPMTTPVQPGTATATSTSPTTLFPFASSSTIASMAVRAARRVAVTVSGGYSITGNLTRNVQAAVALPEQYGPSGSVSVAYTLSHADSLATIASAQETTTPQGACFPPTANLFCRQVIPILQLSELETHQLSKTATLSVGAGVAGSIQQLNTERAWVILPSGLVTLTEHLGAITSRNPSVLTLSTQLGPTVDFNSGQLSNRITASASLSNRVAQDVFLSFTAGALQSIPPDPSPVSGINGAVDVRFRITRQVDVSLGIQGFWQRQAIYGTVAATTTTTTALTTETVAANAPTTTASEIGYVMLTARVPSLHF